MLAIELATPCTELAALALAQGLIINITAGNVIRLLPPLIFTHQDADMLIDKLSALVIHFVASR